MLDGVNGVDALENVLNRVVDRVFAGFNSQTLMSHILQGSHFADNIFLGQFFACDMFILVMIRTVHAAIDAIIGEI